MKVADLSLATTLVRFLILNIFAFTRLTHVQDEVDPDIVSSFTTFECSIHICIVFLAPQGPPMLLIDDIAASYVYVMSHVYELVLQLHP